jgi:hypothetical protein
MSTSCSVCNEVKKLWVCPDCIIPRVSVMTRLISTGTSENTRLESRIDTLLLNPDQRAEERERRRLRTAGLRKMVEVEHRKVVQLRTIVQEMQVSLIHYTRQVESVRYYLLNQKLPKRLTPPPDLYSKLAIRRTALIRYLVPIFSIQRISTNTCSILGLKLPDDSDDMIDRARQRADTYGEQMAAGLGYLVLVLQILSKYLSITLPYPVHFLGAHSLIQCIDDEGELQQYTLTLLDGENPNHFRRAVGFLNQNILALGIDAREVQLVPNVLRLLECVSRVTDFTPRSTLSSQNG